MLLVWGRKSSINVRKVLWCLAELKLKEEKDFERIDAGLDFGKNRTDDFLNMNPNGLVPTLKDGDFVLWESNSIMRYLIKKYDAKNRFPSSIEEQSLSDQWLDWQLSLLWPTLRISYIGLTRTSEEDKDYEAIRKAYQDTNKNLRVLNENLKKNRYCSGNQFNLCDISIGLCVNRWMMLNEKYHEKTGPKENFENITNWIERLETETKFLEVYEK